METLDLIKKENYLSYIIPSLGKGDSNNLVTIKYHSPNSTIPSTIEDMIKYEVENQLTPIHQTQNAFVLTSAELSLELDSMKKEISNISDIYTENYQLKKQVTNINKLHSFKNFEANWNGNNAEPFAEDLINRVLAIINSSTLRFQPDVFPTACQSIQFEYEKSNGNYLEFEITLNKITGFSIFADKESDYDKLSESEMLKMVHDFHSRL